MDHKEYINRMQIGSSEKFQNHWRLMIKNTKILSEQIKDYDRPYYNLLLVWIKSTEVLMNYMRSRNEELQSVQIEESISSLYERLGWDKVSV
jgi:hypothetical protein